MSANPPSPAGSFAGWSFRTWLAKNKGTVKIVVAAVGAYVASLAGAITNPDLNAIASGVVGLGIKFGLDALDYWLSEVPQP